MADTTTDSLARTSTIFHHSMLETRRDFEKCCKHDVPRNLPPTTWKPTDEPSIVSGWLYVLLYSAVAFTITSAFACRKSPEVDPDACDMNRTLSMSPAERGFQIDIKVREGLTFAQAKLIDLAWDVSVGLGGRILHAWALYRVSVKAVTWLLESSTLSLSATIDLLFWPDSWSSLASLACSICSRQRPQAVLTMAVLAFAVAHVLFFGVLWSAATGYQGTYSVVYQMRDQSLMTRDSTDLQICWSLDARGQNVTSLTTPIVLGPTFASLNTSFADYGRTSELWRSVCKLPKTSGTFESIHSYAMTKALVSYFSSHHNTSKLSNSSTAWLYRNPCQGDYAAYDALRGGNLSADLFDDPYPSRGLPKTIKWPAIFNAGQVATRRVTRRAAPGNPAVPGNDRSQAAEDVTLPSTFRLNDTAALDSDPLVVPYNSTLRLNGTAIPIPAPFLNFSPDCRWIASALGECLCYKGLPLTEDFRIPSRQVCTSGETHYWGFSAFVTLVGLVLECAWCLALVYLLLLPVRGSHLVKHGRPATGVVRSILDVAEVVNGELGENTCLYREEELKRELSRCHPVGYAVTERGDGTKHLGLLPIHVPEKGRLVARRIKLDVGGYYG